MKFTVKRPMAFMATVFILASLGMFGLYRLSAMVAGYNQRWAESFDEGSAYGGRQARMAALQQAARISQKRRQKAAAEAAEEYEAALKRAGVGMQPRVAGDRQEDEDERSPDEDAFVDENEEEEDANRDVQDEEGETEAEEEEDAPEPAAKDETAEDDVVVPAIEPQVIDSDEIATTLLPTSGGAEIILDSQPHLVVDIVDIEITGRPNWDQQVAIENQEKRHHANPSVQDDTGVVETGQVNHAIGGDQERMAVYAKPTPYLPPQGGDQIRGPNVPVRLGNEEPLPVNPYYKGPPYEEALPVGKYYKGPPYPGDQNLLDQQRTQDYQNRIPQPQRSDQRQPYEVRDAASNLSSGRQRPRVVDAYALRSMGSEKGSDNAGGKQPNKVVDLYALRSEGSRKQSNYVEGKQQKKVVDMYALRSQGLGKQGNYVASKQQSKVVDIYALRSQGNRSGSAGGGQQRRVVDAFDLRSEGSGNRAGSAGGGQQRRVVDTFALRSEGSGNRAGSAGGGQQRRLVDTFALRSEGKRAGDAGGRQPNRVVDRYALRSMGNRSAYASSGQQTRVYDKYALRNMESGARKVGPQLENEGLNPEQIPSETENQPEVNSNDQAVAADEDSLPQENPEGQEAVPAEGQPENPESKALEEDYVPVPPVPAEEIPDLAAAMAPLEKVGLDAGQQASDLDQENVPEPGQVANEGEPSIAGDEAQIEAPEIAEGDIDAARLASAT